MLHVHCEFPGELSEHSHFPKLYLPQNPLLYSKSYRSSVPRNTLRDCCSEPIKCLPCDEWMNLERHPGHQQEPGQQVKIPVSTAGSAAKWLFALDPVHQPPQTRWAPPALQASAANLPTPAQPGAARHAAIPGLCSVSTLQKMPAAEAASMWSSR